MRAGLPRQRMNSLSTFLTRSQKGKLPEFIQPQLSKLVADVPKSNLPNGLDKIKLNSYRILCIIRKGRFYVSKIGRIRPAKYPI